MLTACGNSPSDGGVRSAPAPVIERHSEVVMICPPEALAPVAGRPAVPDGAALQGNERGMAWLGSVLAWASGLILRIEDTRKSCS